MKKIFTVDLHKRGYKLYFTNSSYLYEYLPIKNQELGIYNIYDEVDYEINTLPKFFEHNSVWLIDDLS